MDWLNNQDFKDLCNDMSVHELKEFLQLFNNELDERLVTIRQAQKTKDLDVLAAVLHKLAGSLGIIGVDDLKEQSIILENQMESSVVDGDLLSSYIINLEDLVGQIKRFEG